MGGGGRLGRTGRAPARRPGATRGPRARWATSPWPGIPAFLLRERRDAPGRHLRRRVPGERARRRLGRHGVTVPGLRRSRSSYRCRCSPNSSLWALDSGVLGLLAVGIPYILTFYLLLSALEDSGYLTSAAVLMDRVFGALGLPGRTAIPLLAAAGCNVPAIYGTRVLRTRRERLLASWLVTLTPCSARSAVVIAALAPFAGVPVALAAFAVVGRGGDRGGRRGQRDDPGSAALARARARPAAGSHPAPRRGQGLVAVQGLHPHRGPDHARRLAGPRARLRDGRMAGDRGRHRSGH